MSACGDGSNKMHLAWSCIGRTMTRMAPKEHSSFCACARRYLKYLTKKYLKKHNVSVLPIVCS